MLLAEPPRCTCLPSERMPRTHVDPGYIASNEHMVAFLQWHTELEIAFDSRCNSVVQDRRHAGIAK